ncbi:type 1 glutamine amidotransferase-like domain-containing protein [Candidatus Pacearchaeota archaeon]|nr:type 1 glutamine amidotransferase-like domain-containing protein [Candidatus Pacearchaeota archaeon]
MTTFILHGGYPNKPSQSNDDFYSEIVKRVPNNGKILFIYFARSQDQWKNRLEKDIKNFRKTKTQKNFEFEVASPEINKLTDQITSSDCIYIRGGRNYTLKDILTKVDNFGKLIEGKIVIGSSFGAYILSKYFYGKSKDRIVEGLGILPIKVLCHYDSSKKNQLELLRAHGENIPIKTIPETEFIIIE